MKKTLKISGRFLLRAVLMMAVLAAVVTCGVLREGAQEPYVEAKARRVYVVGHRGAAGLAPENTLTSFRRALDLAVDAVEMDVHLTSDQKVVVHHDFRLNPNITRKADGTWLNGSQRPVIKALTLAELKTYNVGRLRPASKYARRYPDQQPADGEHIPTLREVISLVKARGDRQTKLWIEIKTTPEEPQWSNSPEIVAKAVVVLLREEDFSSRVFILSFDWRSLLHVQKIAPRIPTVYLSHIGAHLNNIQPGRPGSSPWMAGIDVDDFNGSVPCAVKAAAGRYWGSYYKYLTLKNVEEAHRLGIQVFAWTPDSRPDMLRLVEMGVDGIITNRPDILNAVLSNTSRITHFSQ